MSKPDKATTDRNARTLRELVRQPDNKVCADCKRNDPRWASWNLGVFLCIRCSGFHRGMGTHISKVKSVDLDAWTPEQMESIQKWGNRLANLYWEAHLKAGHIPPEHKMESFIRSKYESKRWAMDGPPPANPSVLDGGNTVQAPVPVQPSAQPEPPTRNTKSPPHKLLSSTPTLRPPSAPTNATTRAPPPPAAAPAAPAPPANPNADLFSLDFNAPAASAPQQQAQQPTRPIQQQPNVKQNILSLFSQAPAAAVPVQPQQQQLQFNQFPAQSAAWGQQQQQQQQQPQAFQQQPQSFMGNAGVGMWGASSGWSAPAPQQDSLWSNQTQAWGAPTITNQQQQPQQQIPTTQSWNSMPAQQPNLFANTNDIWGSSSSTTATTNNLFGASTLSTTQKKDDAFGDLWK